MRSARAVLRAALAMGLAGAGIAHFVAPRVFVAHLPPEIPGRETIVYATGVIELALALGLVAVPRDRRPIVGAITAAYLVAVFPGNVYAAVAGTVYPEPWLAWARLPLQPLFIAAALWSTRPGR